MANSISKLVELWGSTADERRTKEMYQVHLPLADAARIAALRDMFPTRSEEQLITDLLSAALHDLEAGFPYEPGERIIAEDEQGDPIREDVGYTPKFQELTRKHLERLRRQ